jgi:small subunit ribosomal protein S15
MTVKKPAELAKKFGANAQDSGSAEVQIAVLSSRIANVTEHLKKAKFDVSSRRGLTRMVNTRRSLLDWLKRKDASRYDAIVKALELRK